MPRGNRKWWLGLIGTPTPEGRLHDDWVRPHSWEDVKKGMTVLVDGKAMWAHDWNWYGAEVTDVVPGSVITMTLGSTWPVLSVGKLEFIKIKREEKA